MSQKGFWSNLKIWRSEYWNMNLNKLKKMRPKFVNVLRITSLNLHCFVKVSVKTDEYIVYRKTWVVLIPPIDI